MGEGVVRVVGVVMVALCVVAAAFELVGRKVAYARLERVFRQGDYDGCLAMLDNPVVRHLFPPFNRGFLRLNALDAKGDAKEAGREVQRLLALNVPKEQRQALLDRAFNFYLRHADRANAQRLLGLIRESGADERTLAEDKRLFAILIDRSSAHIAEMETELEHASGRRRERLCYLLAIQYESKGDKARSQEYLRQAVGDEEHEG